MRLARLAAVGLAFGAAAGFVVALLRPRFTYRCVPGSECAHPQWAAEARWSGSAIPAARLPFGAGV